MKPITDPAQVEHYGTLVSEMMLADEHEENQFKPDWVRRHGWKIVPVESATRLSEEDIPRLVSVLKGAGYKQCLTVFNEPGYIQRLPVSVASEPAREMATCYLLSVDEANLRAFNRDLGLFRSVLTPEDRSWAISCSEWYNLFAGKPDFVEALLGKPIEQAQLEFREFASRLAKGNADEPLLRVAKHYSTL
jgi:hypothetical protein